MPATVPGRYLSSSDKLTLSSLDSMSSAGLMTHTFSTFRPVRATVQLATVVLGLSIMYSWAEERSKLVLVLPARGAILVGTRPQGGGGGVGLYGPQNCRTEQCALSAPKAPDILF